MKNVACIIARTNSSRLPQKVLLELNGMKMIEYIINKIKKSKLVDDIYICTSVDEEDEILLEIAEQNNVKYYAGSRESVIDRMLAVGKIENATNLIRITGDNIFTDEVYLDLMINYHIKNQVEYTRVEKLPIGVTPEIMRFDSLQKCYAMMNPAESQYLLLYMFQPNKFKCQVLIPEEKHCKPSMTLTVDTPEDYERTKLLILNHTDTLLNLNQIIEYCEENPVKNSIYEDYAAVKFPANLELTFKAFRTEMEARIDQSIIVNLEKGEYKAYD